MWTPSAKEQRTTIHGIWEGGEGEEAEAEASQEEGDRAMLGEGEVVAGSGVGRREANRKR